MSENYPGFDPYRSAAPAASPQARPGGASGFLLFAMLLLHAAVLAVLVYLVWSDRRDARQAESARVGAFVPLDRPTARTETGTWVLDPGTAVVGFHGRAHRFAPVVSAVFEGARGTLSLLEDG